MQEKIIETKQCKHCDTKFSITDKDLEFYKKVSPKFGDRKYSIPTPTLCPKCRQQRRLSFRNERNLYKRKCNATGEDIISIYSPDKKLTVYSQEFWWSDNYNPSDYGTNMNFEESFFKQFKDLQKKVPRIGILNGFGENSDFGNHSYHNKNSYYVCACGYVENCYYCVTMANSKNSVDCLKSNHSKKCYECIDSERCFNSQYLVNCNSCSYVSHSEDCGNLERCLGCKGLRDKKYYILNEKVTPREFENYSEKIANNKTENKKFKKKYRKLQLSIPSRNLELLYSENVKDSNKVLNSKNISDCFDCINSENLRYCTEMMHLNTDNSYDYDFWGENASCIYEVHCTGNSKNILFSNVIWSGSNVLYSDNCLGSPRNCFGCIGLKANEEYCILNKQYTKEEYNILVPKIIKKMQEDGEWGEFFPASLSPFGYNETVAQEYFPLTREEALEKGFNWSDYESPKPQVEKIIPASKLPNNIKDVPDDILNWAIECEVTKKPFRIIPQELKFYRKHSLPIPRRHPDQRHLDRMKLRNPRKLFTRNCNKCSVEMQTTYSPDREEIVYCEKCYNKEIY